LFTEVVLVVQISFK